MGLYSFTNRRRAKDAIMQVLDLYGSDGVTVFVAEGSVYVDLPKNIPDADAALVMHFGEVEVKGIDTVLDLDKITELYKGNGIHKFRV